MKKKILLIFIIIFNFNKIQTIYLSLFNHDHRSNCRTMDQ